MTQQNFEKNSQLPENYIVICNSDIHKCVDVLSYYYGKDALPSIMWGFKYIVCTQDVITGKVGISHSVTDIIPTLFYSLPLYKYESWKELINNFILPDKWYCPYKNREEFEIMKSFFDTNWGYIPPNGINGCCNNKNVNNWVYKHNLDKVGEKITFEQFRKYVMKEEKITSLPDRFAIQQKLNHPLWGRYIKWLNDRYNGNWGGNSDSLPYYGYNGKRAIAHPTIEKFGKGVKLITLEQWHDIVHKDNKEIIGYRFKKDYINYALVAANIAKLARPLFSNNEAAEYIEMLMKRYHPISSTTRYLKEAGVLDLWFEPIYSCPFKIDDYLYLVETSFNAPIGSIAKVYKEFDGEYIHVLWIDSKGKAQSNGEYYPRNFRKATKEEIKKALEPKIEVNGYTAKFGQDGVTFGCKTIDKNWFITMNEMNQQTTFSNLQIESVTLGKGIFSKEQIKQIADYFDDKDMAA